MPRTLAWMIPVAVMLFSAGLAPAQSYPEKPIRIMTSQIGGGNDLVARLIAQGISGPLRQQVIVDNRATLLAAELVSKAPPDGYTLLVATGSLWLAPFLQKVRYDAVKDFAPISLVASTPNILVVHPSLPVKSVGELIALAKARPGELDYASGSAGSTSHLGAELFRVLAGVNMVRIPYKAAGPAVIALVGGQVQLMFATAGSVAPHLKSNRLRALAVTTAQPSALFPGLPTVAASGLAGYESVTLTGTWAPAGTPKRIISRLNEEIVRALNTEEMKERFIGAGSEIVASSPEQFAAAITSDMAITGKLIKDAGIRAE